MLQTDKLIICVAPCGSFLTKEANPNIPIMPAEIAEEVYRSWNEGASIAHIHARGKDGKATTNPEVFKEIKCLIREKGCDIILNFSTSPGREPASCVEDGFRVLEAGPEMATVDIGVVVFMRDGKEQVTLWTRSFDEQLTSTLTQKGIKPEFEVYGVGGVVEVDYLIEKIPTMTKPYWFDFPLGMQRTAQNVTPYSPKNFMHLVDQLPLDSMFMGLGVSAVETATAVQAILLGGHARVGFEDNYYYRKGVLAKSNAQLVERIAKIGIELGRTVTRPDETRSLLGIPPLKLKNKLK
jgi:3-keto-5-aminohexanoate cleavage enzyme